MTTGELAVCTEAPRPVGCWHTQPRAHVRLIAFAHAGAGPVQFRRWAGPLAPDVELWHVTLPGRAARWRERFAREWAPLVDELVAGTVESVRPPFALFGHSLGALLAFEVACGLTRAGVPPAHLLVSGRGAPDTVQRVAVPETDDELLRHVALTSGGVAERVLASPEVLDHFMPILRADLRLARTYEFTPDVALTCPITAMTGAADPIAPPSTLRGWRRRTGGDCEVHVLPGGHFALLDQEPEVLALILKRLTG